MPRRPAKGNLPQDRGRARARTSEDAEEGHGVTGAAGNPVLFVSYSRDDAECVRSAESHLRNVAESCGLDLFLDTREIRPGDAWRGTIEDNLRRARAAVLFLSDGYLNKDRFAASELKVILTDHGLGKLTCFLVPVDDIDKHLPAEFAAISEIQWALPADRPIAAMHPTERVVAFRKLNEVIGKRLKVAAAEPRSLEEFAKSEVRRTLDRKYEIQECLGAGRSSVVFRAKDTVLGRDVAIKVLVHARYESHVAEAFVESARVAARLRHPNIAQVLTSQLHSSPYYVVMEYIEGSALDAILLTRKGALDTDAAVWHFDQLASALTLLHEKHVYHGAIRPSNVLVDTTGSRGRAVLSVHWRRAAKNRGDSGLTLEELTYLTPEQYSGGEMDEKTDQYQLGQLLYELLTGEPLARVNVLADFEKKQASFSAPGVLALVGSSLAGRPGFRDALARMLSCDPKARWPSIEEARRAVQQAIGGVDLKFQAARESFDRCAAGTLFFPRIYAELFALRPELQDFFHSRNTDLVRQYIRLRAALVSLFEAREGTAAALRTIEDYGLQHTQMGIRSDDYDGFLQAIVRAAAASEGGTWNAALEEAWRASLGPGIERMKRAAAP